jgi:hypothetical protein
MCRCEQGGHTGTGGDHPRSLTTDPARAVRAPTRGSGGHHRGGAVGVAPTGRARCAESGARRLALQRSLVGPTHQLATFPTLGPPLTVYVDDWRQRAVIRQHEDRWSHLVADEPEELHQMAAQLGIPLRGFQRHRRSSALNHYDLPESLRVRAIELGAVPITWREMGRLTREWRRAGAPPNPPDQP